MNTWQINLITVWIMAAIYTAVTLSDLWIGVIYGREATISEHVYQLSKQWPIIPLAVGLLLGHFFWRGG